MPNGSLFMNANAISLRNCSIKSVTSEDIGLIRGSLVELPDVRALAVDLSVNPIVTLEPDLLSISSISYLTLNFSMTKLAVLPGKILGNLNSNARLLSFIARNASLTSLPTTLLQGRPRSQPQSTLVVDVSGNNISALPSKIISEEVGWHSLHFSVASNHLTSLPNALFAGASNSTLAILYVKLVSMRSPSSNRSCPRSV
eukprot:m.210486 g.210486  ORF g.210486 m.210486 type:complete len:200 (-) comp15482_c0_seq4:813-1412(-)